MTQSHSHIIINYHLRIVVLFTFYPNTRFHMCFQPIVSQIAPFTIILVLKIDKTIDSIIVLFEFVHFFQMFDRFVNISEYFSTRLAVEIHFCEMSNVNIHEHFSLLFLRIDVKWYQMTD